MAKTQKDGRQQRFPLIRLRKWASAIRKLAGELDGLATNLEQDGFQGSLVVFGGDTVKAGITYGRKQLVGKLQHAKKLWADGFKDQWVDDESDPDADDPVDPDQPTPQNGAPK